MHDDELGAEWTGNIDCIENAREKPRRPPPRRHAAMKIGIVGSGKVGAACAFALVMRATAGEIVRSGQNAGAGQAVAMDICYGTRSALVVDIHDGDYQDLVGAELVMITAGINEKAGSATDATIPWVASAARKECRNLQRNRSANCERCVGSSYFSSWH